MTVKITNAILSINPNAEVVVRGDNIDNCTIQWDNNTEEISKANIKTKMAELQADYEAKQYQRNRASEYPSIAEQLDLIYHAGQGGDAFQAAIKSVKDKHPKG
jgi:hypothetical protein